MTTIAINTLTNEVFADQMITSTYPNGYEELTGDGCKIEIQSDTKLKVVCGNVDLYNSVKDHLNNIKYIHVSEVFRGSSFTEITITYDGHKLLFNEINTTVPDKKTIFFDNIKVYPSIRLFASNRKYLTFGSGSEYAYAGLVSGLSTKEAVELACNCDYNSGFGVLGYKINGNGVWEKVQ